VEDVDAEGATLSSGPFAARTVMWAAGVGTEAFARSAGVPVDASGRIIVNEDLTVPGFPEVYAVGDLMHFEHGRKDPLAPLAQVAMQSGRRAAQNILNAAVGKAREPFKYFDKGIMATIGRAAGVVQMGPLKLWGFPGWLGWLFIHLVYLIGFSNQLMVLIQWAQAWATHSRGVRLITGITPVPERPRRVRVADAEP
jgi:NADH dehydrogenase